MKAVIAIDSFKGSLSSTAAGEAAAAGVRDAIPGAETIVRPLADGGEGTMETLVAGLGGEQRTVSVTGPDGRPVSAAYGVLPGGTAVLEMAAAAGITLVERERRDPLRATTFGVGEMIAHAVRAGCRRFIVGIGGSATNDCGAGMLQALGFDLLDADGRSLPRGGGALSRIAAVTSEHVLPHLRDCTFRVACDVANPLCGPQGASDVFGPQKGASPDDVELLDAALARFAAVSGGDPDFPGSGAAGGLGFAFRTFLGGELQRGVELVLSETRLEDFVRDADVVVTGEGRLDAQTAMGKAPIGVAELAKRHGKPVVAFAGCASPDAEILNSRGIDAFFPILRTVSSLDEAMDARNAAANLRAAARQAFRLWAAARASCNGR
jgi:glycerate kinase